MCTLNHEQELVKQEILPMRAGDRLLVSGRAGSGKTYAIANSVAGRKALFLTPTHPARRVLEQQLQNKGCKVRTIHSAIGWYKNRNDNLQEVEGYLPARDAKKKEGNAGPGIVRLFTDADIIIVDEFSMVGSKLFRAVEEYAEEFGLPVVYSGDRFQLPPVKDSEVIASQNFKTITLNTSVRFPKSSSIFQIGEELRQRIQRGSGEGLPCIQASADVLVVPGKEWLASLKRGYEEGESLLAVSSDNYTLRRLRKSIRGDAHDDLGKGDRVICKQTDETFRNGEELTIESAESDILMLRDVPKCVTSFRTLTMDGFWIEFRETSRQAFILKHEKTAINLASRVRKLHKKGKLETTDAKRILDWLETFNRFELSALATVQKSQGRSVDTVYIDTNTVVKRPQWVSPMLHLRLLYTALTRARKQVILYSMHGLCSPAQPLPNEVVSLVQSRLAKEEFQFAC